MRLPLAIQLARIHPPAPAIRAEGGGQTLFHEALPHAFHARHPDADRRGNPHVRPGWPTLGRVGLEQDLRVLELVHVRFAPRQQGGKLFALRLAQRHPIPLRHAPPSLYRGQNAHRGQNAQPSNQL